MRQRRLSTERPSLPARMIGRLRSNLKRSVLRPRECVRLRNKAYFSKTALQRERLSRKQKRCWVQAKGLLEESYSLVVCHSDRTTHPSDWTSSKMRLVERLTVSYLASVVHFFVLFFVPLGVS